MESNRLCMYCGKITFHFLNKHFQFRCITCGSPRKMKANSIIYIYIMTDKFCVYCQEVTPHYVNEYGALECCNCEPLSESEFDSSQDDPTYLPDSD